MLLSLAHDIYFAAELKIESIEILKQIEMIELSIEYNGNIIRREIREKPLRIRNIEYDPKNMHLNLQIFRITAARIIYLILIQRMLF